MPQGLGFCFHVLAMFADYMLTVGFTSKDQAYKQKTKTLKYKYNHNEIFISITIGAMYQYFFALVTPCHLC